MSAEVTIESVSKSFNGFQALQGIDLEILTGELHVLLGPSGCGKTTLLRMIAGFEFPTSGQVARGDRPITGPGADRALVFQEGTHFAWRTVIRNIEFGLEVQGLPKDERTDVAQKYVNLVGLREFETYYPSQISGGMKQKMVLASVLANDPAMLLMDEPFGALDAQTRTYMQQELLRIWKETQKTVVFVTHSIREALLLGSRISLFKTKPGEIVRVFDLDRDLRTPNVDRDSGDSRLVDLEAEIYKMMRQDEF